VLGDSGSGVMPGRTWIIAPDAVSLQERWARLLGEKDAGTRAEWFAPHAGGDRTIAKQGSALAGNHPDLASIEFGLEHRNDQADGAKVRATAALKLAKPIRYSFRSFDRQYIIPDNRLINRPNPSIWANFGSKQTYITALSRSAPTGGPAVGITSNIPDHDHYRGSFSGRVFALWHDAAATKPNIAPKALATLTLIHGAHRDPRDVFAYVAALLAHPAYTERFRADLVRPGLRVPMTADAALFTEVAVLGREILWLHTFGERFAEGRLPGPPRLPANRAPTVPPGGAIPATPEGFPDAIDYDPAQRRLKIGSGFIDNVEPRVWAYEVSGKHVLRQWFSYRRKTRDRPQIGDKRPPSPLQSIQPDRWLPEYTTELLNVLNVLGLLVDLEPRQATLLDQVCAGPLVPASKFSD